MYMAAIRHSGIIEFKPPNIPECGYIIGTYTIHLTCATERFGKKTLHISSDDNILIPNIYKLRLNASEIQVLWQIAEVSVLPGENGCIPGWRIKRNFKSADHDIRDYDLSRIIKPLEKAELICYKKQNATNPDSRNYEKKRTKMKERAYFLNPLKMREILDILRPIYFTRYFDSWIPGEFTVRTTREESIKLIRFYTMACLQERIEAYENSPQFYVDRGIEPSIARQIAVDAQPQSEPEKPSVVFTGIGPLHLINQNASKIPGEQSPSP